VHYFSYTYLKVNYISAYIKVIITCPIHGDFEQTPNNHLQGRGCPKCAGVAIKNTEQFIKEAAEKHANKYCYEKVNYINALTKVTITCHVHGDFDEFHGKFWHGCPKSFNPNDINPRTKTTYGEFYNKTLAREKLIKDAGYKLIVKWED